ncbi:MAG: serine/threonine protein kinase, partial [Pseudomonadota bacterium]
MFGHITEALEVVHELGIAHRDVKPANIYIRSAGTPVLLDFGAARNTVSGKSKT